MVVGLVVLNGGDGRRIDAQLAALSLEILHIWWMLLMLLWCAHGPIQLQRGTGCLITIWTCRVLVGTG